MVKEFSAGERKKIENRARLALGLPTDSKLAWVGACKIWHGFGCLFVSRVILREDSKQGSKHVAVCPKCFVMDKVPAPKSKGKQ